MARSAGRRAGTDGKAFADAFAPVVRAPRLSDRVADLLLETITSRGLRPGDRLPSERELGDQFKVSRTVVREAVRALAAKGVIEVRTGSGLRVAAVEASSVSQSMSLYLRGSDLDYAKVNEVRRMLEIEIAGLAAMRATEEDIAELRRVCDRMAAVLDDVEEASLADVEFHRALAKATHNELHLIVLDSIGDVLLEIRRRTLGVRGRLRKGLRAHREILEAVELVDAALARRAMQAHLDDSLEAWQRLGRARARS